MLEINETAQWIQKRMSGLTEEEMRFVFDFGFQSLDKELINSLIEELKSKDRDFENIKKRYNAMIGIRPEWEQKAESLIAALEMYRIQEEKALISLERILNAYGVNVSRDDIEKGNLCLLYTSDAADD